MKILHWIKTQLDYRKKYKASLQQRLFNEKEDRTAAKNALDILAKYEILTASLPANHELSTQIYWKEYADRNLMRENENLRSQFNHLQKTYYELSNKWTDNILRYGVQMYGEWQPMEIAPKDNSAILLCYENGDGRWVGNGFYEQGKQNGGEYVGWVCEGENDVTPLYWMPLPEGPK
ncbi:MAG: hypothetical protein AMJ56_00425 [Anaerolineae bacterium SG8_19]|nr:MAG: hypothetical protein AMJ56_00425 [Anaerolineae bacterium SG8_19]